MTNEIATNKKVFVAIALVAGVVGVGAGIVIDNDPEPVVIIETERLIINRSPMSHDEYLDLVESVDFAARSGQLKFTDINADYTLIDAIRSAVGR